MLRSVTPEKQELSCLTSASYELAAVPGIAYALLSEFVEEKKPNQHTTALLPLIRFHCKRNVQLN